MVGHTAGLFFALASTGSAGAGAGLAGAVAQYIYPTDGAHYPLGVVYRLRRARIYLCWFC